MSSSDDRLAHDTEFIGDDDEQSVEAAWLDEIEWRTQQILKGEVKTRSYAEVKAEVTARLEATRASRASENR